MRTVAPPAHATVNHVKRQMGMLPDRSEAELRQRTHAGGTAQVVEESLRFLGRG
jgi:hypothetical protein